MKRMVLGSLAVVAATLAGADTASEAYKVMGLRTADVLTGTVLTARVLPGAGDDPKQVVSVVTYMTGKRDEAEAINVRLDVFRRQGSGLVSVYTRDLGRESDGGVGRGELELVDLDGDGANEIIVSWDDYEEPEVEQRRGEVIVHAGDGFETAWAGLLAYDATKAARTTGKAPREKYTRSIDIPATLRTRGLSLMMKKTVLAAGGETVAEPAPVTETFPLRAGHEPR